jgi:hypothetical protein
MYRKFIRSLLYLVNTRIDIFFDVNTLIRLMVEPRQVHWVATKHVLKYLRGIVGFGLRYVKDDRVKLHGYLDLDWAGSAVDRKSTSSGCFNLGSTVVSWFSRKHTSVALGSVEAKYMSEILVICGSIWLCNLLAGLFG